MKEPAQVKSFRNERSGKLEFTPESTEELNKFNKGITSLNTSIQSLDDKINQQPANDRMDNVTELNKETDNKFKAINEGIGSLSSSMDKFYLKLNEKIANDETTETADVKPVESIISNKLNEEKVIDDQPKIIDLLTKISENIGHKPDKSILQNEIKLEDKKEQIIKKKDKEIKVDKVKSDNKMGKIMQKGFKASVAMADKIAGFLFRMSIAAAASFAKMTAIILSLILVADVIQLLLRKWFSDFKIGDFIDSMKDVFNSAMDKITEPIEQLGAEISYNISKLSSSIVGSIPLMDVKAAAIRKQGIEDYTKKGNSISEDDMNFLTEQRLEDYKTDDYYKEDYNAIKNLDKQTQLDTIKESEELKIQLNKIENQLDKRYISKTKQDEIEQQLLDITNKTLDSDNISKMNTTNVDILSKVTSLRTDLEEMKQDAKPETEDPDLVTSIQNSTNTINNINNTQVNQQVSRSKTVVQKSVVTSTPSPGMHNMLGA